MARAEANVVAVEVMEVEQPDEQLAEVNLVDSINLLSMKYVNVFNHDELLKFLDPIGEGEAQADDQSEATNEVVQETQAEVESPRIPTQRLRVQDRPPQVTSFPLYDFTYMICLREKF
ncbi:unnamed protein product [Bursaphelenchus okinawaensis]|uniref:Uncharacterized protein n=1 Tax=Bursaphelenchus okinawaensis TaxID=465554 RepID=A0A811L1E6_9BILA|nr:unnamed protein product [Bursaphelenchus okinawaensis]CAG9114453.1 unnamed protein product [Bursaphelenchus okinawaensis]